MVVQTIYAMDKTSHYRNGDKKIMQPTKKKKKGEVSHSPD